MRQLFVLPLFCLALMLPTGCSTPMSQGDVALLASDLQTIGKEGVIFALGEKPDWRTAIEGVRDSLNTLADKPTVTIAELLAVLQTLPFDELEGSTARLAFAGATIILRRTGLNVDLGTVNDIRPLSRGLSLGMSEGLEISKKILKK